MHSTLHSVDIEEKEIAKQDHLMLRERRWLAKAPASNTECQPGQCLLNHPWPLSSFSSASCGIAAIVPPSPRKGLKLSSGAVTGRALWVCWSSSWRHEQRNKLRKQDWEPLVLSPCCFVRDTHGSGRLADSYSILIKQDPHRFR